MFWQLNNERQESSCDVDFDAPSSHFCLPSVGSFIHCTMRIENIKTFKEKRQNIFYSICRKPLYCQQGTINIHSLQYQKNKKHHGK